MGEGRQIRFFIPPFFFFLSLLWGLYWSDPCHNTFGKFLSQDRLTLFALLAGASLPIGFLINVVSIVLLKLFCYPFPHTWETWVNKETLRKLLRLTSIPFKEDDLSVTLFQRLRPSKMAIPKTLELAGVVVFNHGELCNESQGLKDWLTRQWSAFIVSINSIVALVGSWLFVLGFDVFKSTPEWHYFLCVLCVVFAVNARTVYKSNKRMLTLLADRHEELGRQLATKDTPPHT